MKIGFIVNPIAGMGGTVALKGTDGPEILRLARERGAVPSSEGRADEALSAFGSGTDALFLCCEGEMGGKLLSRHGLPAQQVYKPDSDITTGEDTRRAAAAMAGAGAQLLLFAGGDGTARDICSALQGCDIPVIGIPAGVKIHSAVFAVAPQRAGQTARDFAEERITGTASADVMDIDEQAFRSGQLKARLFGELKVPLDHERMQQRKSGSEASDACDRQAIGHWIARHMSARHLYLIGSGSTMTAVTESMGLNGTLLGIDGVKDRRLVGIDLTERQILSLIVPGLTTLCITVIGGQGHLFGRGSPQISPAVIRAVGKENLFVAAAPAKLRALFGRPLLVDSGDAGLDRELCGYIRVLTGWNRFQMCRVER